MLKHSSMLDRAPSARQVHRTAALGYARRTGLDLCARCAPIAFMRSQRRKKLKQTNAPGITECAGSTGGAYALTPHTFACLGHGGSEGGCEGSGEDRHRLRSRRARPMRDRRCSSSIASPTDAKQHKDTAVTAAHATKL